MYALKRVSKLLIVILIAFAAILLIVRISSDREFEQETKKEMTVVEEYFDYTDNRMKLTLEELETTEKGKNYQFSVVNEGTDSVEFSFSTSQRYEYELSSNEKGVISRYSDGRAFMQVLGKIELEPQEKANFDLSIPTSDLEPGEYQLKVYLATKDLAKFDVSTSFTIRE